MVDGLQRQITERRDDLARQASKLLHQLDKASPSRTSSAAQRPAAHPALSPLARLQARHLTPCLTQGVRALCTQLSSPGPAYDLLGSDAGWRPCRQLQGILREGQDAVARGARSGWENHEQAEVGRLAEQVLAGLVAFVPRRRSFERDQFLWALLEAAQGRIRHLGGPLWKQLCEASYAARRALDYLNHVRCLGYGKTGSRFHLG